MEIAFAVSAHDHPDVVQDTVESIQTYATDNVLVVVDGRSWAKFESADLGVAKLQGFNHGALKSPYRNVALSLMTLYDTWPDSEWFCYCEYDVLFGSDRFIHNLAMAAERGIWMMGNDGHVDEAQMPMVESMLGVKFKSCYYLIGCCQFFHKAFLKKLHELDFFDRFLKLTNEFPGGYFPSYTGYDISEHLYPTIARHYGGNIGVFATWDGTKWHGAHQYYPVRWKPDLEEEFQEGSVMHPLKSYDHPLRVFHREKREKWKTKLSAL